MDESRVIKLGTLTLVPVSRDARLMFFRPYALAGHAVLECFTPDRVMFGSDWPVQLVSR